jgi:hypothetical protein
VLLDYYLTGHYYDEVFRVLHCSIKTMGAFIYVLRSLRINYAYRLDDNMRGHRIFRLFKHENDLVLIVLALTVLRMLPAIVFPGQYPSPVARDTENGTIFFVRSIIEETIWQFILVGCLWMQRDMRREFGLVSEIGSILVVSLLTTLVEILTIGGYALSGDMPMEDVLEKFECFQDDWPINQMIVMFTCIVMFVASIAYPLTKVR